MSTYTQKLESVGLVATDKSKFDTTVIISGGASREKAELFSYFTEPFSIVKTEKGWEVNCVGDNPQGNEFVCSSFDEVVTRLADIYRTLGLSAHDYTPS